jgi:hypothetical protein
MAAERILGAGGVERLTYSEVAKTITAAAAKAKGGEVNLRAIDHLVAQSVALRSGPALPVTGHVRQLTGQDPIAFAEFAHRHRERLRPDA